MNGGSDTESGLAAGSSIVERDEAPLDNGDGSCDAFPDSWATVTLSGGDDTTVASGKCYRYRELLSDSVGNQGASGASSTAKVDTSAPAAPSLSSAPLERGGHGRYRLLPAERGSGQFQVAATERRAVRRRLLQLPGRDLGLERLRLGRVRTYSHSGSPSDPAEPLDVTAVNGAGLVSATSSFTVTPDASAPSGISASITGGYYTSPSVAVTLDNGSDSGSGVDASSGIVERDEVPLDNGDGTCDAFPGSWSDGHAERRQRHDSDSAASATATATSSPTASATRRPPAPARPAKVDTSAPTPAPSLSYGSLLETPIAQPRESLYYLPSAASGQFAVTAASS